MPNELHTCPSTSPTHHDTRTQPSGHLGYVLNATNTESVCGVRSKIRFLFGGPTPIEKRIGLRVAVPLSVSVCVFFLCVCVCVYMSLVGSVSVSVFVVVSMSVYVYVFTMALSMFLCLCRRLCCCLCTLGEGAMPFLRI